MLFTDCVTHYVYSPVDPAFRVDSDQNGDGLKDTHLGSDFGYAFNMARPTVHDNGANVALLDGHVERVRFAALWAVRGDQMLHSFWHMMD